MATPYLGEIKIFAGNFAPRGYALCNGQLLSISQNTALFSIIGTFYGGNGVQTFALPDLRARAPLHWGQAPGLSPYVIGQSAGENTHTLQSNEVATHSHAFYSTSGGRGAVGTVTGNSPANTTSNLYSSSAANTSMSGAVIQPTTASQPHENRQPLQGLNFIIALQGIFPARN